MAKGGKYLRKNAPVKRKKGKVLSIVLIVLAVILVAAIGAGVWYYNHLLGMLTRPEDLTVPTENTMPVMETEAIETTEETVPVETSPEDTWPQIVSDENITHIMLVGQAARAGEEHLISDTMILCSINRETKTLTLTSLMRDMRLVWPHYVDTLGKPHSGHNRINMAYNMGYSWTKNKQDSMDVLESIVQYNFGIPVERTVEIDFDIFMTIVDVLGGVTVELSQEEYDYMKANYPYMDEEGVTVGVNNLGGFHALCYARMRKVGHGDYERTERQREVITGLINNMKNMGIMDIHKLFTQILPMITTDLSNKEITNYAFEFIPMLKDLKVQSLRIPFDDNERSVCIDGDYMLEPADLKETARRLREAIGMTEPAEVTE